MRLSIIIFFISALSFIDCNAQKAIPEGTFYIKDNIYIDKEPISNIAYATFLASIEQFWAPQMSDSLRKLPLFGIETKKLFAIRDSTWRWKNKNLIDKMQIPKIYYKGVDTNISLRKYLGVQKKIRNIPVAGINYEQAKMYCKWRTDMVLLYYSSKSHTFADRNKFFTKINYRLPKIDEWESAFQKNSYCRNKMPFYWEASDSPAYDIFIMYNKLISELLLEEGSLIQADSKSYKIRKDEEVPKNEKGFRCVCEVND